MKKPQFQVYRYQILPITRDLQGDLFTGAPKNLDELLAQKNRRFADALKAISNYSSGRVVISEKVLHDNDDITLIKFNVSRKLDRETKDFRHESMDNWPSFLVFIWNHADRQIIAIERRFAAFQHTDTVVRLIAGLVNQKVGIENLRVHWEPMFEQNVFWNLIDSNEGKVQEVRFELITPNMANISSTLSDELKAFAKNTNAAQTDVDLKSDTASALKISKNNAEVNGMVEYAAKGGGDIALRIRGIKRTVRTSRSVKTIEIEQIEAEDPLTAVNVLKTLLDK
jgi:hypothetical protein